MVSVDGHAIGMRELRHQTREVLDRVQQGETIDITDYGRLVARIVPVAERTPTPVLQRLIDSGRARPATRPGFMARMHAGDGTDRLGDALADQRADERW
jgi:prevent-host-death family protein